MLSIMKLIIERNEALIKWKEKERKTECAVRRDKTDEIKDLEKFQTYIEIAWKLNMIHLGRIIIK